MSCIINKKVFIIHTQHHTVCYGLLSTKDSRQCQIITQGSLSIPFQRHARLCAYKYFPVQSQIPCWLASLSKGSRHRDLHPLTVYTVGTDWCVTSGHHFSATWCFKPFLLWGIGKEGLGQGELILSFAWMACVWWRWFLSGNWTLVRKATAWKVHTQISTAFFILPAGHQPGSWEFWGACHQKGVWAHEGH